MFQVTPSAILLHGRRFAPRAPWNAREIQVCLLYSDWARWTSITNPFSDIQQNSSEYEVRKTKHCSKLPRFTLCRAGREGILEWSSHWRMCSSVDSCWGEAWLMYVHPHVALHAALIAGLNITGLTNHAHCCNHNHLSGKTSVLGISWITWKERTSHIPRIHTDRAQPCMRVIRSFNLTLSLSQRNFVSSS